MRSVTRMGFFVGMSVALVCGPVVAQETTWQWPERGENLTQLPADFSGQRLRAVMTGFTSALGVRCSHCHVGEEGQPLSTYDFASDDNPKKETARRMLAMLGDINGHLREIDRGDAPPVNMWCHTCHRGAARPQTLLEALTETLDADGGPAAVRRFHELRERYHGRGTYDFGEAQVNAIGYAFLERDVEAAIGIFRANVEHHPASSNAADSLAEAYMSAGEIEQAIAWYQQSLRLDPANENAVEKLGELRRLAAP